MEIIKGGGIGSSFDVQVIGGEKKRERGREERGRKVGTEERERWKEGGTIEREGGKREEGSEGRMREKGREGWWEILTEGGGREKEWEMEWRRE